MKQRRKQVNRLVLLFRIMMCWTDTAIASFLLSFHPQSLSFRMKTIQTLRLEIGDENEKLTYWN